MRISLFPFQEEARDSLLNKISAAHSEIDNDSQIITFSAPTGAGKTIIMTSLIENVLFGTDTYAAEPDAVFIWLSDMPDLNEQSRLKIERKSDRIQPRQLVVIDSNFDNEYLDGGNIYFLNTQKLGSEKLLTQRSDRRQYPIWETLTNTVQRDKKKIYVIIDEAHRGMNRGQSDERIAHSIMQKFILGSTEDGLCAMPLIIGITATPQRFQQMISDTDATKRTVTVRTQDVIDSGLIKDRIIIHCPEIAINAEITMFQKAAHTWKEMTQEWENHSIAEHERLVKPILVVQVNDRTDSEATTTDISTCLEIFEDTIGRQLEVGEVIHTFNDEGTLNGFSIPIVKAEPENIEDDTRAIIVFFKMNLSTGWDCPRAEVLMSFRAAQDYTYVAQLLGRMVRTPLAHRIEMNAKLNAVHLFLPYFDKETVNDVVNAFKNDENAVPAEAGIASELVTLVRNERFADVFDHMNDLVTYRVEGIRKESHLKRLDKLATFLATDGVSRAAIREVRSKMTQKIRELINAIKVEEDYDGLVSSITGMSLNTLEIEIATNQVISDEAQNIDVAISDIEQLYKTAERQLGDAISMHYRIEESQNGRDDLEVKIDLIVISKRINELDDIEQFAGQVFDETYNTNRRAIQQLPQTVQEKYDRLLSSGSSATPIQWRAPFSIDFNYNDESTPYDNHLYVDESNIVKVKLNTWESGVLNEEASRTDFVTWLRNIDRKPWSIEIPYKATGIYKSMFPDLMVVRRDEHGYIFDILEPHDSSRSDNYPKAIGLADFARIHNRSYGRIQLIRKLTGADGVSHFYRLDLTNVTVQRLVLAIHSNEELDRIFDSHSMVE